MNRENLRSFEDAKVRKIGVKKVIFLQNTKKRQIYPFYKPLLRRSKGAFCSELNMSFRFICRDENF